MVATKDFEGTAEQASQARKWVDGHVQGSPLAADVALVVAELVGNAVRHTRSGDPGGRFTVRLQTDPLRVEVADQGSPTTPRIQDVDDEAENGRGLPLVEALASRWGVTGNEHGRTVWAELTTP